MIIEQFKPDAEVEERREVRIDIPVLGPQRKTVEIIDGMAVAEGDIVLGAADQFTDVAAADAPEGVVDSVAKSGTSALWPDGVVPYEIASGMPNQSRVHDAIDHWEDNTPIHLVPRSGQNDYVHFFSGSGCWSRVGRSGGRQRISLAPGCGTGAAIHEIAHAIGIWHEQSRSDRDVFITVKWSNISNGKKHNFNKHTEANDIGRYDYDSIMHYGAYAFSKNGNKTIVAPENIGQRGGLSEGDIDAVFRMYAPSDTGSVKGVTDNWKKFAFDHGISAAPVVLAGMQTFNGPNTAGLRMSNLNGGDAKVLVEEEKSADSETSHTEEVIGFLATQEGTILDESASRIGEAGTINTGQSGGAQWHTVRLNRTYSDPVVFMQIMSHNGPNPSHLRVRNVRPNSFKFQIEEWDYLNQKHTGEDIGYVVLEKGTHRLRNGIELDAGTIDTNHEWKTVRSGVASEPVVISQCQTRNGPQAVVTRHRNVGKREFDLRLQEEEANNGKHRTETIGYLVVAQPEQFEFGVAREEVTHKWSQLDYESDFHELPATIASIQTFNGPDTADVRMKDPSPSKIKVQIEEEKSDWDLETKHVGEAVSYAATPEGPVYYAPGKQLGEAGVVTRNQASGSQWHTIDINDSYQNPVVFAQLMSKKGKQPAHVRVRNVTSNSFDLQIEEWRYILVQAHASELIGYLVLESGKYPLPDGGLIEIGTTRTNHSWTSVSLDSQLQTGEGNIAVVSRCQTYNGPQAVVTRHRNASPSGFDVRLQEEEAGGKHKTETIGYLSAIHEAQT